MSYSEQLFERAICKIPGGVNSPVRAFLSVGGTPRFIDHAKGQYMYDVDGNQYLDYIGSWGPMILGHNNDLVKDAVIKAAERGLSFGAATEVEVIMAEVVCQMVPFVEMIRMVNSGTEAVMSAIRAARGFTGRDKVIKFEGCYHGHADSMLVKAGSGVMTSGIPSSSGVPNGCAKDTLTARYNDLDSVIQLMEQNKGEVACIIVEPIAANMGVVVPDRAFLQGLRDICNAEGSLLIFDEVITGFRLQADGASGYFHIIPDLVTYGKIIGAGMPVGAYGGRADVMKVISPVGSVYQAGTLSGNPIAMAAGLAQLNELKEHPEIYIKLNATGQMLRDGITALIQKYDVPCQVNGAGSLACLYFTKKNVIDYETAKTADIEQFAKYFHFLLEHGIYIGPSQFEAMFVSYAHTEQNIMQTLDGIEEFFIKIAK